MRHFELLLTDDSGKGISLSDFKVTFDIEWFNIKFSRVATIKIYNLSQATNNRILGKEFSKLRIIAGYDGLAQAVDQSQVGVVTQVPANQVGQTNGQNYGQIYDGDIRFSLTGRDNPTDTYVLIQAVDGHQALMGAVVTTTLAAGYTVADVHAATMQSFSPFGVVAGITGDMPTTVFPRGRVIFQAAHKTMDNIAQQCGATWQIVEGKVQLIPVNKYIQEAIVLNSNTGLIGMPQQTMGAGVNVRCLINPNIRVGGLIELDQTSVYRAALSSNDIQMSGGRISEKDDNGNKVVSGVASIPPASVATDGVYIVQSISYTGDTRGQAWYMDMMCFARGSKDLLTGSALNKGVVND
ncbi:baseplate hub protein [Rouxiella silvae]